jgi:hypothetical protein
MKGYGGLQTTEIRLEEPGVQCGVEQCDSRIAETTRYFLPKQPANACDVNPESFLP